MDQPSHERLRHYLAQLAPGTQALLMRECERALSRGEDAVATLVLDELRRSVRGDDNERLRGVETRRQVFRPLEPFLVDGGAAVCPGRIRRPALEAVWQWLEQEALREVTAELTLALADAAHDRAAALSRLRAYRRAAGEAITTISAPAAGGRLPARLAVPRVAEDLAPIGAALVAHEALENLAARLPGVTTAFGAAQIRRLLMVLDVPSLKAPLVLPFALAIVMARLAAPWQIVRLCIHMAGSDDEARVAAVPYGIVVTMTLHELARVAAALRDDMRRGRIPEAADRLKLLHDGVRGLRTELDLRPESAWGRQLAAIRKDIAGALRDEIEGVPGRVRRLLRPRKDRDIGPATQFDATEADEIAALIDFIVVCRDFAGELAVSELTQRAFTELQQDVERIIATLVEQLKGSDAGTRGFRLRQFEVALRFCAPLLGPDFAALMARAAENNAPSRQTARAG